MSNTHSDVRGGRFLNLVCQYLCYDSLCFCHIHQDSGTGISTSLLEFLKKGLSGLKKRCLFPVTPNKFSGHPKCFVRNYICQFETLHIVEF